MATPPDSPGPEEALFEFESTRARQQTARPVALEELLRQTKFSRQEIRVMYRGFKQGKERSWVGFSRRIAIVKIP
ncbi:Kv channel-interacting protein 1 [Vespula squamosa]|uniref:Kv channel-interacting protein 1 n=1 Tax=Vespula squamosa TaxID=30214 RepID=A0ABD2AX12_VESSQ